MRMKLSFPLKLPTAIIGLGLTGRSIEKLLKECGIPGSQILTFDEKDSSAQFQDFESLIKTNIQSMILSPGVSKRKSWIQDFSQSGGQITSELEIAFSFLQNERVIGVTGSVGKSTCVSLLGAGLQKFAPDSFVGGNLGFPLADYVIELFHGRKRAPWIALELSSYQLETFINLKADAAILTSFTPNHLERYDSLEDYYQTKWSLVEKTHGPIVYNEHGADLKSYVLAKNIQAIGVSSLSPEFLSFPFHQAKLVGHHNYDNLSLVIKLAHILNWPESALLGFLSFAGLPHRLENLGEIGGLLFVNDSKATTIESVLQAVTSTQNMSSKKTHLLIGGRDKNLPWAELKSLASVNRTFYFFGECARHAQSSSKLSGKIFSKLDDAIRAAVSSADDGDLVLLSPGGTSLDEFKSFEDRGIFFKAQILKHLKSRHQPGSAD